MQEGRTGEEAVAMHFVASPKRLSVGDDQFTANDV